jgi:hypothetical protein
MALFLFSGSNLRGRDTEIESVILATTATKVQNSTANCSNQQNSSTEENNVSTSSNNVNNCPTNMLLVQSSHHQVREKKREINVLQKRYF